MTTGERIKELRKAVGKTQQTFAEALGVKRSTVATYEAGLQEASDRTISDICRVYNVSEAWLRTGEGEMFEELDPDEELMRFVGKLVKDEDAPLYRLAQKLAKMPPEVLDHLNAVIDYALEQEGKSQNEGR